MDVPDVIECLCFAHVDLQVSRALMDSNNHTLVHVITRLDEHVATSLCTFDAKSCL